MAWYTHIAELSQEKSDFVLVTVLEVRGHAPREVGTKMVVTAQQCYETIGGGNLEQTAIVASRALLQEAQTSLRQLRLRLNPVSGQHGVQCCGGEVTLLLEKVHVARPTVAIFGAGHVAKALLRVLAPLPLSLRVIDSRKDSLDAVFKRFSGEVTLEHQPVPEVALEALPEAAAVIIMTHDHAEDAAILERALRRDDWSYLGLIGSQVKWANLKPELARHGLQNRDFERVVTPIGLPEIRGKSPEVIAIGVAAQLLIKLGF